MKRAADPWGGGCRGQHEDDEEEEEEEDRIKGSSTGGHGLGLSQRSAMDKSCRDGLATSSSSSHTHREDMRRLQRLYGKAQAELSEKDEAMKRLSNKLQTMEQAAAKLRTKVKALEELRGLAVEWQSEMEALRQHVEDLKLENQGLASQLVAKHKALQGKGTECRAQAAEREGLSGKMQQLELDKKEVGLQLKAALDRADMERRNREAIEQTADVQRQAIHQLSEDRAALRGTVNKVEGELSDLRRQLYQATSDRDSNDREMQVARDLTLREVALRSEMECLRQDQARLLKLLFSTQEYAGFRRYWEDAQEAHYIRHLSSSDPGVLPSPPPPSSSSRRSADSSTAAAGGSEHHPPPPPPPPPACWIELERLANKYPPADKELAQELKREVLSWVPTRAVRLMREFWVRHMPEHLSSTGVLDRLLLDLNEVWRTKEDIRVQRLKHRYEDTLKSLRRQVGHCRTYDNVVAEHQITRLRKEIQTLRSKANRHRPMPFDKAYGRGSSRYALMEERHTRDQLLRDSTETIERLTREVSANPCRAVLGGVPVYEEEDRDDLGRSFLSGAAWIGRKAVAIVDEMGEEVDDVQKESIEDVAEHIRGSATSDDFLTTTGQQSLGQPDQVARVLSHHHKVLLDVQSSTQTCRARMRELLLQASSGSLKP